MKQGRPRKDVDVALILQLRDQGLSVRKIAEAYNGQVSEKDLRLGRDKIHRILSEKPAVRKTLSEKHPRRKVEKRGKSKPKSVNASTTPTPSNSELPQAHHIAFSLAYKGKQPLNSQAWKFGWTKVSRYEGENYVLNSYKRKLVLWLRGIEGASTKEINAKARGVAEDRLAFFAQRYGLKLEWRSFAQVAQPEMNLMFGEFNDAMREIIKSDKSKAKEQGMLAGDSTHPEQVEFVGERGRANFDGIMYAITESPKIIEKTNATLDRLDGTVAELSKEIRLHLRVMHKMERYLDRITKNEAKKNG